MKLVARRVVDEVVPISIYTYVHQHTLTPLSTHCSKKVFDLGGEAVFSAAVKYIESLVRQ